MKTRERFCVPCPYCDGGMAVIVVLPTKDEPQFCYCSKCSQRFTLTKDAEQGYWTVVQKRVSPQDIIVQHVLAE